MTWQERFEANYLDGDKVQEGQTLSSSECLDAIKSEREALLREIIALSDKIEAENPTEFNEWKAFKQFRNTLRDRYKN